jgi:hypothetical protein
MIKRREILENAAEFPASGAYFVGWRFGDSDLVD